MGTFNIKLAVFVGRILATEMEIIGHRVGIRYGYEKAFGTTYRDTITKKFVKKNVAEALTPIYEYTDKTGKNEFDFIDNMLGGQENYMECNEEETLIFQENLARVEETEESVYQRGPISIKEALKAKAGSSVLIKGQPVDRKEAKKTTREGKEIMSRYFLVQSEGGSIWSKPGFRTFMKVRPFNHEDSVEVTLKGEIQIIPITLNNWGYLNFLDLEERVVMLECYKSTTGNEIERKVQTIKMLKLKGINKVVILGKALFPKFVPEDVTGNTGAETEETSQFIKNVNKGYISHEVHNLEEAISYQETSLEPNEFINSHWLKLHMWEKAMTVVIEPKLWNKFSKSEFVGEGQEGQLAKITQAEQVIKDCFGDEGFNLAQELVNDFLTGDTTEVPSFKDASGTWSYIQEDVLSAIQAFEVSWFEVDRANLKAKMTERLDRHVEFLGHLKVCDKARKEIIIEAMQIVIEEGQEARKVMLAKDKDGNRLFKAEDGNDWHEKLVKPVSEQSIQFLKEELENRYGMFAHGWMMKGVGNLAGMMVRGEVVPMNKREMEKAYESIESKIAKIKFYGGLGANALTRYFSAWNMLKSMEEMVETGYGHIDQGIDRETAHREQLDAEAKQLAFLSWRYTRE